MTPPDLREAMARAMCLDANDNRKDVWDRDGIDMRDAWRSSADAALAIIRAVFANPTPEMIRASVQGWLDSGLMSGAIREAAREALGDADTR